MERLTKRNPDGSVGISEFRYYNYQDFQKLASKLADYEDKEENNLLIEVPYPVGTPIYFAFKLQGVKQDRIRRWQINNKGLMFYSHGNAYLPNAIGKTVFLTREEAERKVEEWQKNMC